MGFFSKISAGLKKTRDSIMGSVNSMLHAFTKIDEELFEELEEILIMGDVGAPTAGRICDELRRKVKERGVTDPEAVRGLLYETVAEMLRGGQELRLTTKPSVILVIGVNGVGKTTTIGKLAARFRAEGKKVVLGAADTFRAAAIEQLEIWAERAGADIVKHTQGADPAAVVFDSIAAAKARGADVVICDTAGRLPDHRPGAARRGQGGAPRPGRHHGTERGQSGPGVQKRGRDHRHRAHQAGRYGPGRGGAGHPGGFGRAGEVHRRGGGRGRSPALRPGRFRPWDFRGITGSERMRGYDHLYHCHP